MSAARPIPHWMILLSLTGIAALGFWMGFRDSLGASGGIRACTPENAVTLPGGAPIPMATPVGPQPQPMPEVKAEPEKKKPEPVKAEDPGTAQHDLPPLPGPAKPAPLATPPATQPAKPTPTEPAPDKQPDPTVPY